MQALFAMHTCTLLKNFAAAHETFRPTPHFARHDIASTRHDIASTLALVMRSQHRQQAERRHISVNARRCGHTESYSAEYRKASGRTMVSIRNHDGAVKIFVAYAFLRAVSFGIYAAQVPCLRLKFSYAIGSSVELNSLSGICIIIYVTSLF